MRRMMMALAVVFVLAAIPLLASAETVEGSIQGLHCVSIGKVCPVGKEDPIIAAESTFVIYTKDQKHFLVPNLDRAILARHINENARVEGKLDLKYASIMANKLEIMGKDGTWKIVWTKQMQQDVLKELQPTGDY